MKNTEIAKKLNDEMGNRNGVEIYCNGNDNLVVRGSMRGVGKTVLELTLFGLEIISPLQEPDETNPYDDGKYTAIVGKR